MLPLTVIPVWPSASAKRVETVGAASSATAAVFEARSTARSDQDHGRAETMRWVRMEMPPGVRTKNREAFYRPGEPGTSILQRLNPAAVDLAVADDVKPQRREARQVGVRQHEGQVVQ